MGKSGYQHPHQVTGRITIRWVAKPVLAYLPSGLTFIAARIVWSVADEPIGSDEEAKRDKPTNVNQVAVQCVDGEPILPETEALKRGKSLRREAFVMMPRK